MLIGEGHSGVTWYGTTGCVCRDRDEEVIVHEKLGNPVLARWVQAVVIERGGIVVELQGAGER